MSAPQEQVPTPDPPKQGFNILNSTGLKIWIEMPQKLLNTQWQIFRQIDFKVNFFNTLWNLNISIFNFRPLLNLYINL